MSNETVEKFYEGQPPEAPMPEAPIDSAAPMAMPMPAAMPSVEMESVSADAIAETIEMSDYPGGRGGMNAVPMSEADAGESATIGTHPPEMEMPSA